MCELLLHGKSYAPGVYVCDYHGRRALDFCDGGDEQADCAGDEDEDC